MEQVRARPVKDRHEVIAYHLHAEFGEVTHRGLVVFDKPVPSGQADLNIVMDVHGFDHVHVEARAFDLLADLLYLLNGPYLSGQLIVKRPDDAGHTGDLLDIGKGDGVVALTVPAPCHLHNSGSSVY